MRRTLALLGAATLAVAGLAGPANASDIDAQTDLVFAQVDPDLTSPHTDAFYDITSSTGSAESLGGTGVIGCVGADSTPTEFMEEYASTDVVDSNDFLRTTPSGYTGPPHTPSVVWEASADALDSPDFRLELAFDIFGTPSDVIDIAGSPNHLSNLDPDCVAQLPSQ